MTKPRQLTQLQSFRFWPALIGLAGVVSMGLLGESRGEIVVKKPDKKRRVCQVVFRVQPVIAVQTVHLAGTFNGWKKDAQALKERTGTGVYETELELPFGRHEYKFVLNGQTWIQDPGNSARSPDGNGGFNSVVHVGLQAPAQTVGELGDGKISGQDLIHDPSSLSHASAVDGDRRVILRMHTLRRDVKSVKVEVYPSPDAGARKSRVSLRFVGVVAGRDVYEARLYYPKPIRILHYRFVLNDGGKDEVFGKDGLGKKANFQLVIAHAGRFETPDWVRDAVFYQIFPDRFCNGDTSTDLKGLRPVKPRPAGKRFHKNDAYFEKWGARPSYFNFFGGDLKGIESKLEYLKDLGVTAIYLNPIFKAWSNHRYDAADYEAIDPRLGTDKDFESLMGAMKKQKMRLLLDAVFNHTGHKHYAFEDLAKKGKDSKFKDWYFPKSFPIRRSPKPNYACWWDFPDLPQLNTAQPEVIAHLLKVAKAWLDKGADGWRLDVPNEVEAVNPEFWTAFRKRLRKHHPESYIVGEIWTDATPWLNEDKFDATMNYPVRRAVLDFIVRGDADAKAFSERLGEQRASLPEAALRVQFNLLGSHDTARLKHVAKERNERVALAYGFLFSYLGAPVIYYGDEIGMSGDKDPDCRRCFPWDEAKHNATLKAWIKTLGRLRQAEAGLRRGRVQPIKAEGRHLVFARVPEPGQKGRALVVVMNASDEAQAVTWTRASEAWAQGSWVDLIDSKRAVLHEGSRCTLKLPAQGLAILAKSG